MSLPVFCLLLMAALLPAKDRGREIIAYVFPRDRILQSGEIAAQKLTRINYAFANIAAGRIGEGFPHDRENFAVLTALKARNPALQILVSVGGWTWSGAFSDMALTPSSRSTFIESAVSFVNRYSLDGLDIDWEYPGLPGIGNPNRPEDKQNYTALLRELRKRFDREEKTVGRRYFTSIAAGASEQFLAHTEMAEVARYVDTVNLMTYDYYEQTSDRITGHHAPLHTNPKDPKQISVETSVRQYRDAGVPAAKLVLGVPFYGHAWTDVPNTAHGLYQPGGKADIPAAYADIVSTLIPGAYMRYWDETASAPFLYNAEKRVFVSYDDAQSIAAKCRFVLDQKLRGIMFWEYSGDRNSTLLDAINSGLR